MAVRTLCRRPSNGSDLTRRIVTGHLNSPIAAGGEEEQPAWQRIVSAGLSGAARMGQPGGGYGAPIAPVVVPRRIRHPDDEEEPDTTTPGGRTL